jgi:hypothetical protein
MSEANLRDQLSQLGWAVKLDLFPDNQQRLDLIKKQVLDVSLSVFFPNWMASVYSLV